MKKALNSESIRLKKYREERNAIKSTEMTLRDYFAAAALTGLMAHPDHDHIDNIIITDYICSVAYTHADCMLIERERNSSRRSPFVDPRDQKSRDSE